MTPWGDDSHRFCAPAPHTESGSAMRSEGDPRPLRRPSDRFPGAPLRSRLQRCWSERVLQPNEGPAPRDVTSWHQGGDLERHRFRSLAIATVLTRDAGALWIRHLLDLRTPMVSSQPLLRYLRAWPGKA